MEPKAQRQERLQRCLEDTRNGVFDPMPGIVPTYLQYDIGRRRRWERENPSKPPEQSYRELSEVQLRRDWLLYAIGRYERGASVQMRTWRMLTRQQREEFIMSPRARRGGVGMHSESPNNVPAMRLNHLGDPVLMRLSA